MKSVSKNYREPFISSRHPHRGFTLMELLVAIAIIATLAAIVIPVGRNLKEGALAAGCSSNMRQCVVISNLFTSEHNGRLPRLHVTNGLAKSSLGLPQLTGDERIVNNPNVYWWPDMLTTYEQGADYFCCPKLKTPATKEPGGGNSNRMPLGIGINYNAMAPNNGSDGEGIDSYSWTRMSDISEPTKILHDPRPSGGASWHEDHAHGRRH